MISGLYSTPVGENYCQFSQYCDIVLVDRAGKILINMVLQFCGEFFCEFDAAFYVG